MIPTIWGDPMWWILGAALVSIVALVNGFIFFVAAVFNWRLERGKHDLRMRILGKTGADSDARNGVSSVASYASKGGERG